LALFGNGSSPGGESSDLGYMNPTLFAEESLVMIQYRLPGEKEERTLGIQFHTILEWATMITETTAKREQQLLQRIAEFEVNRQQGLILPDRS
jgi:hypothetical protein